MNKNEDPTPEDFDRLLRWLDSDRDQAAMKYEKIRLRLIRILVCRGCGEDAEDLADRIIDRVTRKLKAGEVPESFVGDKALYFYSFVSNICHEYFRELERRRNLSPPIDPPPINTDDSDAEYACLEECMGNLEEEERWLVIEYYRFDKSEKIKHRKQLSIQLGIDLKALRLRVYRIRVRLRGCIEDCLVNGTSH